MGKSKQMRTVLVGDMRDYVKQYGKLIALSLVAAIVCYGFLVFCGNIRIDTEELINHPGSKLGWLTIGRFGLAFLKSILGLSTHYVLKSGILFFLFFWMGANLMTYAIYHFSGGKDYPYWIFLLLYVTSNIWSYQIYFSVQQAEVACAMFALVVSAIFLLQAFFEKRGMQSAWRIGVALVLLVLGLGAYQAMAAYYITICIVLFLAWMERYSLDAMEWAATDKKEENRKLLYGIAGLIATFGLGYILYHIIANNWFMATASYMEGQMGWGRYSIVDCVKNVLRTAKNLLLGVGPRNFSFYAIAVLLALVLVITWLRERRGMKWDMFFALQVIALFGLIVSPLLMTIYMGEMLVTRSQFALPVAAAFLGMYAIDGISHRFEKKWVTTLGRFAVIVVIVVQCGYNLRLAYTDEQRFISDKTKTDVLITRLREENGGSIPTQPIVFVGYQEADMPEICRRTEMYGWSFYGWDYSKENPTGPTHRIVGLVQAATGCELNENASETQKQEAVKLSESLSDFPSEGSIVVTDEMVVVRLSAVREREALDWW